MLFICLYLCAGLFPITAAAAPERPSDMSIQTDMGIVMDSDTGTVLCGENMGQSYYPASITKVLTALIVLEQCNLNEMAAFSHDDVYNVEAGSSSASIGEGGVLTMQDCLYALMSASANENVNALTCHVGGSKEASAQLMNGRIRSPGCTGNHPNSPNDLNDESHCTTAHNIALIARVATQNPEFLTISDTQSYQSAPVKRTSERGYMVNHHRILNKDEAVHYPDAFVGKIGCTSLAGDTLVTCARKNDMTLIVVMLNGYQFHYPDTKALFGFGFRSSQSLRAADYGTKYKSLRNDMTIVGMTSGDSVSLELDRSGCMVILRGADFTDTQFALTYGLDDNHPQAAIACISYTYNNRPVGSVYLCPPSLEGSAASLTSQDASGASAISIGQDGEAGNPAPSDPSGRPDVPGLQDTPEAPSSAGTPHGQMLAPAPAPRQNITLKEGTAANIRIPADILAILGTASSSVVIIVIVTAMKIHVRRKEEEDLYFRRQQKLEYLEDIGLSSSSFEKSVAQRRVSSPPPGREGKKGRGRGHKKSFSRRTSPRHTLQ